MSTVGKKNELILPQTQHKARDLHGVRFSAHRHRVFCCVFFFRRSFRRPFRAPARPVIVPPLFHHFFTRGRRFCIDSSVEGATRSHQLFASTDVMLSEIMVIASITLASSIAGHRLLKRSNTSKNRTTAISSHQGRPRNL